MCCLGYRACHLQSFSQGTVEAVAFALRTNQKKVDGNCLFSIELQVQAARPSRKHPWIQRQYLVRQLHCVRNFKNAITECSLTRGKDMSSISSKKYPIHREFVAPSCRECEGPWTDDFYAVRWKGDIWIGNSNYNHDQLCFTESEHLNISHTCIWSPSEWGKAEESPSFWHR